MKVLAISEQYFPRLAGTVSYVHETLQALVSQGVEVELMVPGPRPDNPVPDGVAAPSYAVTWIEPGYPQLGDPTREQRYRFCQAVNAAALERMASQARPEVVHVLFGLFLLETLESERLRALGARTFATIHNMPPHECGRLVPDAPAVAWLREAVRLKLVAAKNHARVRKHSYDIHIVPSRHVADLLFGVLPRAAVNVIGHGPTGALLDIMHPPVGRRPAPGRPVRILTAGGYVPHKRQHLIPDAAARLKASNLDFKWDVVGPDARIPGYFARISAAASALGLDGIVRLHKAVPVRELAALYDQANLYVQPSTEEGFCITALDAAAAGLPVIASPAGALAEIAQASGGLLVPSSAESLAAAIMKFVERDLWRSAETEMAASVRDTFSWQAAAQRLLAQYAGAVQRA